MLPLQNVGSSAKAARAAFSIPVCATLQRIVGFARRDRCTSVWKVLVIEAGKRAQVRRPLNNCENEWVGLSRGQLARVVIHADGDIRLDRRIVDLYPSKPKRTVRPR